MTEPIAHHHLPIFFLKAWTGADGKLTRYNRPYREVVAKRVAPKSTGYRHYLYSLDGVPPGREQQIEKEFMTAAVDTPAAEALRALLTADPASLTVEHRRAWTMFLMAMSMRDPNSLAELQRMAERVLRETLQRLQPEYEATRQPSDPPGDFDYVKTHEPHIIANLAKTFLPGLIDNEKVGQHIMNMNWATWGVDGAGYTFLVGDRPFIRTHGYNHPDCTIIMPIGPSRLFFATNTKEQRRSIFGHRIAQIVRDTNDAMAKNAVECVYGISESHLQFVERRLRRPGDPIRPGHLDAVQVP